MMRTTRQRTWATAAIALLLTLAACGDDAETRPADARAEPEEVTNTVQVAATEYAFDVPSKVEGGVVSLELNNEGPSITSSPSAGSRTAPRSKTSSRR